MTSLVPASESNEIRFKWAEVIARWSFLPDNLRTLKVVSERSGGREMLKALGLRNEDNNGPKNALAKEFVGDVLPQNGLPRTVRGNEKPLAALVLCAIRLIREGVMMFTFDSEEQHRERALRQREVRHWRKFCQEENRRERRRDFFLGHC